MYTEKAIERLNNIDWNNIGENGHKEDMGLGVDFIRKMAVFCNKNNITPTLPFMTDLASFFADCAIEDDVLNKCNDDVRNIIENPSLTTSIVTFYLKAAVLSDRDIMYAACMDVYEPMIRLFEKGGSFVYRERGMSFINSGLIPLANWFKKNT